MQVRKWSYQRFWGGRSSKETPVVLFVAGDVTLEAGRVLSVLSSSFETDVYRADDVRLAEDGTLRPDAALRQLIARSRAPVMVFGVPEEMPASALSALIDRFQPARAQWWFEDYQRHLRDAAKADSATLARNRLGHLLSTRTDIAEQLLPVDLQWIVRDIRTLNDNAVLALLWFIRHARFRNALLHENRNVHLYGGEQLRLTPKETLEEVLQAAGIGTDVLSKLRFSTGSKAAHQPFVELPDALADACLELQDWLDRHSTG